MASTSPNGTNLGNGLPRQRVRPANGARPDNGVTLFDGLDLGNGIQSNPRIGQVDLRSTAVLDHATGPYVDATSGSSLERWIDAEPIQKQLFLRYLVECALPAGTNVGLKYRGETHLIGTGVGNLGPSLQTGVMTTIDQERVSSCLLARTNARGEKVDLDLLGSYPGFERPSDPAVFKVREGAFYGNLFVSPIEAFVWFPDRVVARTCTSEGDCGGLHPVGAYARMMYDPTNPSLEEEGDCFVTGTERPHVVSTDEQRFGTDKLVPISYCTNFVTGKSYHQVMTVLTK